MAMALPGKAVHVGLHLWLEAGMKGSADVAPSLSSIQRNVGISRFAAGRGLAALEVAGLVAVERHAGRKPRVRLLEATDAIERTTVLRGRRAHLALVRAEPVR
jgi:DNA-binding transcriptional ArsR family regulator